MSTFSKKNSQPRLFCSQDSDRRNMFSSFNGQSCLRDVGHGGRRNREGRGRERLGEPAHGAGDAQTHPACLENHPMFKHNT